MMHYINIDKKRLCGRNNNQISPILFDAATEEPLQIQFITSNNQLVHLNPEELSGLYLAGNTKPSEPSYDLLFLSKDYTIENDILTFNYSTYTKNFLRKITKRNQEILIEIGQIALEKKTLLLRDYALANPRVYIEGNVPEDVDWLDYYTKEEVNELVAQSLDAAEEFASGLALELSGALDDKVDTSTFTEAVDNIENEISAVSGSIEGFATTEYVDAAVSGKASKDEVNAALENINGNILTLSGDVLGQAEDISEISGAIDSLVIPTKVSELDNDSEFAPSSYVDGKANDAETAANNYADGLASTLSTVIDAKQNAITADNKLDYALLSGVPEDNPALVPIEVKTATEDCIYEVDFTGKAIQKYDLASATGGSNSLEILFTNLANVPSGVAPTIELQIPVTEADVSTISLPAGTQVIDMPDSLTCTSGKISYADIVFRAEKDVNDMIKVYCNYSYNFDEEEEV